MYSNVIHLFINIYEGHVVDKEEQWLRMSALETD